MAKFVPYEKLSKKEKRKIDNARRGTWGNTNPVGRIVPNKRKDKIRKEIVRSQEVAA